MAITRSLNTADSVLVTTYYGGASKGRSYDFTVINDKGVKAHGEVTEAELFSFIAGRENSVVIIDDGVRPTEIKR